MSERVRLIAWVLGLAVVAGACGRQDDGETGTRPAGEEARPGGREIKFRNVGPWEGLTKALDLPEELQGVGFMAPFLVLMGERQREYECVSELPHRS